jgi:hypothetical protein
MSSDPTQLQRQNQLIGLITAELRKSAAHACSLSVLGRQKNLRELLLVPDDERDVTAGAIILRILQEEVYRVPAISFGGSLKTADQTRQAIAYTVGIEGSNLMADPRGRKAMAALDSPPVSYDKWRKETSYLLVQTFASHLVTTFHPLEQSLATV